MNFGRLRWRVDLEFTDPDCFSFWPLIRQRRERRQSVEGFSLTDKSVDEPGWSVTGVTDNSREECSLFSSFTEP